MANAYFKNITEEDKFIISEMCRSIENDNAFFVSTDKKFKMLVRGNSYTYDYTYNLIRFGFATKARGAEFHAKQHSSCPNQYTAQVQANFINTAVEMGLYTRQTSKEFNGGNNVQIIWM
jgi:hypothetical protein